MLRLRSLAAGTARAACYGAHMAFVSTRLAAPLLALLALSACNADRSRYPSLAIRPAERAYATRQPVAPALSGPLTAQLPAGADLAVRITVLRETALAAHARFTEQQGTASRLAEAAKGAAPGTEAWSRAAIALAGLESARSQGMIALADLDRLFIAATEMAATGPDADLQTVTPAHRAVEALLGEEDRAIAALSGAIGG
ncbi:MAG: hypothetical protein ACKVOL_02645 [Novosphingobium sp.]